MVNRAKSTTYTVIRRKKSLHNTCYATQSEFYPRESTGRSMGSPGPRAAQGPGKKCRGLVDEVGGASRTGAREKIVSDDIRGSRGAAPAGRPRRGTPVFSVLGFGFLRFGHEIYYKNKRGKTFIDGLAGKGFFFLFSGGRMNPGDGKSGGQTRCSEERQGTEGRNAGIPGVSGGIPAEGRKSDSPREIEGLRARVWAEWGGMRGLGRGKLGEEGGRTAFLAFCREGGPG